MSLAALTQVPSEQEYILAHLRILPRADRDIIPGHLWIRRNRIQDVLTDAELPAIAAAGNVKIYDAKGLIAMPPLWNAHTHCALNFFRGLGHDAPSPDGLSMIETVLFPAEKNLTPELIAPLSYGHLIESLQSGVAGVFDHYYFVDGVGIALERLGMRGFLGETVADLGGAKPGFASWQRARATIENWPFSSRIRPMIAPHAADTVSRPLLTELGSFAQKHHLPLHMHLSQTNGERQRVLKRENMSPVQYADQCGAVFPQALLVHLVTADDTDLRIIKHGGATAGYCPTSQIIYEKLAPISGFIEHRIPVVVGTDCAASNDSGNMMAEQKTAALTTKMVTKPQPAQEILAWTTLIPHRVTNLQAQLGAIEAGKLADLTLLSDGIRFFPNHHFPNNLVYSAESRDVQHVVIDGRWVLWNQQINGVNPKDLHDEYAAAVNEILRRIRTS